MSCVLNIKILEARGLHDSHSSSSSSYCIASLVEDEVHLSDKEKHKSFSRSSHNLKKDEGIFVTKKVKGTNPLFEEEPFIFSQRISRSAKLHLLVEIWGTGVLNHDFLGQVSIPLSSLPPNEGQDKWYDLQQRTPADNVAGEIRLLVALIDKKMSTMVFTVAPATSLSLTECLGAELVESLSPKERKRQEIFFELLTTERSYVRDLEIIHTVFIKGVRDRALLSKTQCNAIFSNIETLIEIHTELLNALEAFRGSEKNIVPPGLVNVFSQKMNNFKLYSAYASNHLTLPDKLRKMKHKEPSFAQFLEECFQVEQCRNLTIDSFLILPLQRICKYPLFFENLIKNTEDAKELEDIKRTLEQMKEIVTMVNTRTQQESRIQEMLELQSAITNGDEYNFLQKDRYIVRRDEAKVMFRKEKRTAHVILFNDLLVIAKQSMKDKEKPLYRIQKTWNLLDTLTTAATATPNSARGMTDSVETLQVNPLLLRRWNSQQSVKESPVPGISKSETTKGQEMENERKEELLQKLHKEKCKFRLVPIGQEDSKENHYEFTMKSPEACAEWLEDMKRLRTEQTKLIQESPRNSIVITQPGAEIDSSTVQIPVIVPKLQSMSILDSLRGPERKSRDRSATLTSPRLSAGKGEIVPRSDSARAGSRGSLILGGALSGGKKKREIARLSEALARAEGKAKRLELRLQEAEALNVQLKKENSSFREEAVLLRQEIAKRNALFMSDSHDLLYSQLKKGAETLTANSPRVEKKQEEGKEKEQEKEIHDEEEEERQKERRKEEEERREKEEQELEEERKRRNPSGMLVSGSFELFAQMGRGATRMMNTPIVPRKEEECEVKENSAESQPHTT